MAGGTVIDPKSERLNRARVSVGGDLRIVAAACLFFFDVPENLLG
jgi:hypothetical protein